jgi:hypothetical protein
MTFVAVLASGIALSISTCLNVWRRSQEAAELNQEARAIVELLSRDIRGAYLGLEKNAGYFIGKAPDIQESKVDTLELCTESSAVARAALLPDEVRAGWDQSGQPPVTDYVAVRYTFLEPEGDAPAGLYRSWHAVPVAQSAESEADASQALNWELVSEAVVALTFLYYDGESWSGGWETAEDDPQLPLAVAIELTLRDARGSDHVYQSIVPIAAR